MAESAGRPQKRDSDARQRDFLRRLTAGEPWQTAAKAARIKADTVLRLLDQAEFRAVAHAVIGERLAA